MDGGLHPGPIADITRWMEKMMEQVFTHTYCGQHTRRMEKVDEAGVYHTLTVGNTQQGG